MADVTEVVNKRLKKPNDSKSDVYDLEAVDAINRIIRTSEAKNNLRLEMYSRSGVRFYSLKKKRKSLRWKWSDLLYALDLLELDFSKPMYNRFLEIFNSIKEERNL